MAQRVSDLMTSNPACVTPDTNLQEVALKMKEYDCGCIPIVESHDTLKPIGTITDRDIAMRVVAEGRNPLEHIAGDFMSSPCVTVREDDSLKECCRIMEENQIRRVVVVDSDSKCCGMIAQADIAREANDRTIAQVVEQISEPNMQTADRQ